MIMIKRALAILLILTMSLGIMSGCKPKNKTQDNSSVSNISDSADENSNDGDSSSDESTDSSGNGDTDGLGNGDTGSSGNSSIKPPNQLKPDEIPSRPDLSPEEEQKLYPGRVKNLGGRTINLSCWLVPKEGSSDIYVKEMNARKKYVEEKLNCKLEFAINVSASSIATSIAAGRPKVDVWYLNGFTELLTQYVAGYIQPLDSLKVFDFKDTTLFNETSQTAVISDKHYALGINDLLPQSAQMMFFNQRILTQAGINEDVFKLQKDGKWTWSKFEEMCKKINAAGLKNGTKPITGYTEGSSGMYQALLYTYGTDIVAKKGDGSLSFSQDTAARSALAYYTKLTAESTITVPLTGGADTNGNVFENGFLNGDTAFGFGQFSYMLYACKNYGSAGPNGVQNNYGMLCLPKKSDSDSYSFVSDVASTTYMAIPYGVKAPNEVATAIELLFNPKSAGNDYVTKEKDIVGQNTKYTPALNKATGDGTIQTMNMVYDYYRATKRNYVYNQLGRGPGLSKDWYSHIRKIANNQESAGSVIQSVQSKYDKMLSDLFKIR